MIYDAIRDEVVVICYISFESITYCIDILYTTHMVLSTSYTIVPCGLCWILPEQSRFAQQDNFKSLISFQFTPSVCCQDSKKKSVIDGVCAHKVGFILVNSWFAKNQMQLYHLR